MILENLVQLPGDYFFNSRLRKKKLSQRDNVLDC